MTNIPFLNFFPAHFSIKGEMRDAFYRVYESSWFVLGKEVEQFENAYAVFNQVDYCVGLSNGLDALHLALKSLNIGVGDEVIVPSNTYVASALAVSYVGAKPVFVEPDLITYNLNPDLIEAAITSKTKVIMPVHLYGQSCEMEEIMQIAQKYNLYVVEDNAQSQGAKYNGKLAGSWGDVNATSFYPGKNLGALGDAGAVTTSSYIIANKIKTLRNYGSGKKYYNEVIGHNMRLDELQAAFLSVKLKYLKKWTLERQQISAWYNEALFGVGDLILPYTHPKATHVFHLFVIRTSKRDALQEHLNKNGIGTLIHYPVPPHLQKAYEHLGFKQGAFPITEMISESCLSLPIWPGMEKNHVDFIVNKIKQFYGR